jgi:23S rRNA (uracil1939-C5)-methyltransferase
VSSVPPVVKSPLQLTLEKLVYGGEGLARLPADEHGRGKAVFIPFVLEGEQVEATLTEEKPGFSRARAEKILEASAHRIEPGCPYFQRCGGCHYQHSGYEHQLEIKAAILKENLRRLAKLELDKELTIHASPPWNYRNRSRLKLQIEPEFALGYFKFNSHELLPVEQCPISSALINRAITEFWKWGRASQITVPLQEVEFFANAEDSELLVELLCAPEASEDSAKQTAAEIHGILPQIVGVVVSRQSAKSARQGNGEPERLAGSGAGELVYRAERASYRVSAGGFFQVNRYLVNELVDLVTEAGSGEVALDLYAGGGLFSSILAGKFAQVIAVEPSQISYPDLLHNSPGNVKTVRGTCDQYLQKAGRLRPDFLVVDPPRSGLGASVVKGLVALRAPRITYVSCDPATLARDLSGLLGGGYRVEQAHLVDLFPQTFHLESVFHLVR